MPSCPTINSLTWASLQRPLGWSESCTITMSPTWIILFTPLPGCCLWEFLSSNKYSAFQRLQKCCRILLRWIRRLVNVECSTKSSSRSSLYGPSGKLINLMPTMRWDGVIGTSVSSVDMKDSGLKLTSMSTSVKAVWSSSKVSRPLPIVFRRHVLTDLTTLSNFPPHHGAFSRSKSNWTFIPLKYAFTVGWFKIDDSILSTTLKVSLLSDSTLIGKPLLAVNCLKHLRNACAVMSCTISRWIALTTQHVYKHMQTFSPSLAVEPDDLTWSGPAKSTPV